MSNRSNFLNRTVFAMCIPGALMATPAVAQSETEASSSDEASIGLNDIIVTAQRREERLQDVAVAVTAIPASEIENARIQNITDLASIAPNVFSVAASGANSIPQTTIRGLNAGNAANDIVDNGVSYYLDGVYLGSILGSNLDVADIERVEIIRGPAGTLFGTNATGGAINYITSGPKGALALRHDLSYGRWGSFRARTRVDLPEWRGFSLSATYLHNERASNVRNRLIRPIDFTRQSGGRYGILTSASALGESTTNAIHVAARFQPVETLTLDYKFDWSDESQNAGATQILGFSNGAGGANARSIILSQVAAGNIEFDDLVNSTRLRRVYNDATTPSRLKVRSHLLTTSFEAADWLVLKNLTSWRRSQRGPAVNQLDGAGGLTVGGDPYRLILSTAFSASKQFSSETQAIVTADRFDLTAGFFYYDRKILPGYIKPANPVFGVIPGSVALGNPPTDFQLSARSASRSYAGYGQATYHVTPEIDVTVGARYTRDEKQMFSTSLPPGREFRYENGKATYLATLAYKLDADKLLYLKYSTGYIAGGFAPGPVVVDPNSGERFQGDAIPYAPEVAKSWELGLKADWMDRRLRTNFAAFLVDYTNLQSPVFGPACIPLPTGGGCVNASVSAIINAGKSRAYGVEAELSAAPTDELRLSLNAGYTDFDFKRLAPSVGVVGVYREALRPKLNVNASADYKIAELPSGAQAHLRVDANYRSSMHLVAVRYTEAFNLGLNDLTERPGQFALNARASLVDIPIGGASAQLSLWGRNLTDNKGIEFATELGSVVAATFQEPLSYGIDLRLSF